MGSVLSEDITSDRYSPIDIYDSCVGIKSCIPKFRLYNIIIHIGLQSVC